MSAPQFTPGPWSLSPNTGNITRNILGSDEQPVCSVWNLRHALLKDPTPDTNLILAAPDLYGATEQARSWFNDEDFSALGENEAAVLRRLLGILDVALAKARGDQ